MVLRLTSCSPRRPGSFATVVQRIKVLSAPGRATDLRELDTSIGVSEPHDFTVRSNIVRQHAADCSQAVRRPALPPRVTPDAAASTAPHPASVTIAIRPSCGVGWREFVEMICPTGEAKYFCKGDSTQKCPAGKSLEPLDQARRCLRVASVRDSLVTNRSSLSSKQDANGACNKSIALENTRSFHVDRLTLNHGRNFDRARTGFQRRPGGRNRLPYGPRNRDRQHRQRCPRPAHRVADLGCHLSGRSARPAKTQRCRDAGGVGRRAQMEHVMCARGALARTVYPDRE